MTDSVEAARSRPCPALIERLTGLVAICGGLVALSVAALVVVSVLGRWLFDMPVEGDFEFVKMASAIAVFAFLPYTQARRGHIIVDTFTGHLPAVVRIRVDAFWDFLFALAAAFLASGLLQGTIEAYRSGESTMQLLWLIWPVIGLCTALCALLAITALVTGLRLIGVAR